MRVSREQAAANRRNIVAAAAALFRQNGFDGVGIDDIMAAAGLTHGGFYRHFASKQDLAAEALANALATSGRRQDAMGSLAAFLTNYLSAAHRDNLAGGCALASLGADAARSGQGPRQAVTRAVQSQITRLAGWLGGKSKVARRQQAIATMAAAVGALTLARAVNDAALSDEILAATRAVLARSAA